MQIKTKRLKIIKKSKMKEWKQTAKCSILTTTFSVLRKWRAQTHSAFPPITHPDFHLIQSLFQIDDSRLNFSFLLRFALSWALCSDLSKSRIASHSLSRNLLSLCPCPKRVSWRCPKICTRILWSPYLTLRYYLSPLGRSGTESEVLDDLWGRK